MPSTTANPSEDFRSVQYSVQYIVVFQATKPRELRPLNLKENPNSLIHLVRRWPKLRAILAPWKGFHDFDRPEVIYNTLCNNNPLTWFLPFQ